MDASGRGWRRSLGLVLIGVLSFAVGCSDPTLAAQEVVPLELASFAPSRCTNPGWSPAFAFECAAVTFGRAHCLRLEWERLRVGLADTGRSEPWWDLETLFERWYEARCAVDEAVQWVDQRTREWSDGTASSLVENRCKQRMLEERLFLHEAVRGRSDAFARLVDARQEAGRRRRSELLRLRELASGEPNAPTGELGTVDPQRWREFVAWLDVAAEAPNQLARRHCKALRLGPDCEERLALYFHSVGADADALDICFHG